MNSYILIIYIYSFENKYVHFVHRYNKVVVSDTNNEASISPNGLKYSYIYM